MADGIPPRPSIPEGAASEEIVPRRVTPAERHASGVLLADVTAECKSGDPPEVLGRRRFDTRFAQLSQDVLAHRLARATDQEAQMEHVLATVIHEREHWKDRVQDQLTLLSSLRKVAESSAQKLRAADERMALQQATLRRCNDSLTSQLKERDAEIARLVRRVTDADAEIVMLRDISARYFARTEEAFVASSGGPLGKKLQAAAATVADQRRVIARLRRQLQNVGITHSSDPEVAIALAAGIDAPGLSPAKLSLNDRLCRMLEARWPELSLLRSTEPQRLTLNVGVAPVPAVTSVPAEASPAPPLASTLTNASGLTLLSSTIAHSFSPSSPHSASSSVASTVSPPGSPSSLAS